jgi:hypothetical protein
MKTVLQLSTIYMFFLLFCGFSGQEKSVTEQINHNSDSHYETLSPVAITGDFKRVSIDSKRKLIIYEYTGKQITFELNKEDVLVKVKQSNREVLQLRSSKRSAEIRLGSSGEWKPLHNAIKEIDSQLLALVLGNPTYYGRAYIGDLIKNREATELESRIIDLLNTASSQTNQSSGTTSGSCRCSGQSVTVSCPNGCGITCRDEEREVCGTVQTETGDMTNTSDCWKETFCIGACAC